MTYSKINDLRLHNVAIRDELEAAIQRVLTSGWLVLGPEVSSFESAFADWCGAQWCCGVANGTDALELGLRALGVNSDAEVIVAANAGMYSSNAILSIGAEPVYADIDPDTLNLDVNSVAHHIGPRTRAIVATHLFGRISDMPALRALADSHNIPLMEDCAQAHGASLSGKKAGSWGDAAAFSFYPTKNLGALGDGGAVVTSREDIHESVVSLRQYGWKDRFSVVRQGGCNSRLDELQAAVLKVKLGHLDDWTRKRQVLGQFYSDNISHPLVKVLPFTTEEHVFHLFVVRCSRRDELKAHLEEKGVATDIHYPNLDYQQPVFAGKDMARTSLPHSELAAKEILTLPCYPELSAEDASYVVDAVNAWKPTP